MPSPINFADKSLWNVGSTQLNNTNVPTVGEVNAMFAALGATAPPIAYGSQDDLGKRVTMRESDLIATGNLFTLSTGDALYGAIYQLVQLDSGATSANAVAGRAAFLLDTATGGSANSGAAGYVVTDEANAASVNHLCGIFLNTITPGNFGIIAVHGKVGVYYDAAVTSLLVAGSSVILKGGGIGTFNNVVGALAFTGANIGTYLGHALEAPVASSIKRAYIRNLFGRY